MRVALKEYRHRWLAVLISPRGLWWLVAALLVLCLLLAARLVFVVATGPAKPVVSFPPAVTSSDVRELALYPSATGPVVDRETEKARINAELLGVVTSGARASASIVVSGGKVAVYQVGDDLAAGVTVEAIEPTRVVVREQGVLRHIALKSLVAEGGPGFTPVAVDSQGGEQEAGSGMAPALPLVEVSTILTDDGQAAIRVDRIDGGLGQRVALNSGDIIVAVDGQSLASIMADGNALERLAGRQALSVTLIRNGVDTEIEVDGEIVKSLMGRR